VMLPAMISKLHIRNKIKNKLLITGEWITLCFKAMDTLHNNLHVN
jgi:hypothetical protein